MENHLEILIERFLRHELTPAESDYLEKLLLDPVNMEKFQEQVEIQFLINQEQEDFNPNFSYAKIKSAQKSHKRTFRHSIFKYAAVLVVLFGVSFLFWNQFSNTDVPEATLVYIENESGETQALELKGEKQLVNRQGEVIATKTANKITYIKNPKAAKLEYTTIKVPNGTLFQVVLSDGTKVELNAGTKFKFPIQFLEGKDRQVYIEGEGYFKVSKDTLHPFKVTTSDFDVSVLGTQFNVSAYESHPVSSAVLVEGSVRIGNSGFSQLLNPGERASTENSNSPIEIEKVNTEKYTAWRQGVTIFQNDNFGHIMKTLERKYNITFQNNYPELEQEIFTATIVDEEIEQVLALFSKSRPFKYEINERKVTIDKK